MTLFPLNQAPSHSPRSFPAPTIREPCAVPCGAGDDAQTVECQVECASLISSVAGRNASTLLSGGALGAVEGLLERIAPKHRSASIGVFSSDSLSPGPEEEGGNSFSRLRSRPSLHARIPSCPFYGTGPERPLWDSGAWGPR